MSSNISCKHCQWKEDIRMDPSRWTNSVLHKSYFILLYSAHQFYFVAVRTFLTESVLLKIISWVVLCWPGEQTENWRETCKEKEWIENEAQIGELKLEINRKQTGKKEQEINRKQTGKKEQEINRKRTGNKRKWTGNEEQERERDKRNMWTDGRTERQLNGQTDR